MIISIYDFPIRIEGECIKNCKGDILLDFKCQKKKLIQFISENISAINDGKRVYKKRLTKTFYSCSLEESLKIINNEMFEQGYIKTKGLSEIEYNIICKEGKFKINYKKIKKNMVEEKKEIGQHLENLLINLLDAKSNDNLNEVNKEIAIKDLIKLLNIYYSNIIENNKQSELKGLFNKHQEIWYSAIISANKKVKYPLISITSGLWRCYIITVFCCKDEEKLLKQVTGWSGAMLEKEKLTYDMKVILLSIGNIFREKEEIENK